MNRSATNVGLVVIWLLFVMAVAPEGYKKGCKISLTAFLQLHRINSSLPLCSSNYLSLLLIIDTSVQIHRVPRKQRGRLRQTPSLAIRLSA